MVETKAVRFHAGDKTLKFDKKTNSIKYKSRSALAKKKDSPLAIWRKVSKEYLKRGGFVTIPKKGTSAHKAMLTLYDKAMKKAGLR